MDLVGSRWDLGGMEEEEVDPRCIWWDLGGIWAGCEEEEVDPRTTCVRPQPSHPIPQPSHLQLAAVGPLIRRFADVTATAEGAAGAAEAWRERALDAEARASKLQAELGAAAEKGIAHEGMIAQMQSTLTRYGVEVHALGSRRDLGGVQTGNLGWDLRGIYVGSTWHLRGIWIS